MGNIAIVAVGFNRPLSLARLLDSLQRAKYSDISVDLIISIDFSGNNSVSKVAEDFYWRYGKKKVILHPNNLGLFRHIISCGDLTNEYENIIILEDDLIVSPEFFNFTRAAIQWFRKDSRIAGISLYSHSFNFQTNKHFIPIEDGYDNFFIQMSQSWGQVWNREKWHEFKDWISRESGKGNLDLKIPNSILSWPSSSWMKVHNRFIVERNYYFVYPRVSLTTNFSDVGTHRSIASTSYQVPLQMSKVNGFQFSTLDNSESVYDLFFENCRLQFDIQDELDFAEIKEITINLFGEKKEIGRFELTCLKKNSRVLASFGRNLKPLELNVLLKVPGDDIFLYDHYQEISFVSNKSDANKSIEEFIYYTRIPLSKIHLIVGWYFLGVFLMGIIKRKLGLK